MVSRGWGGGVMRVAFSLLMLLSGISACMALGGRRHGEDLGVERTGRRASAGLVSSPGPAPDAADSPQALRAVAHAYYEWRNENHPVASSDRGLHTWDDRLTDFSPNAIQARRKHTEEVLAQVKAIRTDSWAKEDRIDWLLLRAQLERVLFFDGLFPDRKNPQTYTRECADSIFSLLKKEYAPPRTRAKAATARLSQMPALLEQGKKNLTEPVRLYAQLSIESARRGDSLYTESLQTIANELTPTDKQEFARARDAALAALHGYADWLEQRLPKMAEFQPMGEAKYNYLLKNVYLLPLDGDQVAMLGQVELARYRALEALLPDPSLADPNPARSKSIPKDQEAFLRAYESREAEIIQFLRDRKLVTLPP